MLFIHESDALERLARIEGETWRLEQLARPDSPYGFQRYLRAFREVAASGLPLDAPVSQFVGGGDGAIYGKEGYSRYVVLADGEIVLLAWSIKHRAEKRSAAQAAGVRISDEPKPNPDASDNSSECS